MIFLGDNGDIKFPMRFPILQETLESTCSEGQSWTTGCDKVNELDLSYQMQASQPVTAGYFGGYTAKQQELGRAELLRMSSALNRPNIKSIGLSNKEREFRRAAQRMVKDIDAKGSIRTAMETTQLALHANHQDKLAAEAVYTFPTATFPVVVFCRREEIEHNKRSGFSVITGIRTNSKMISHTDAPADLLYGYRGNTHAVGLLSPSEMFRFWKIVRIEDPKKTPDHSDWTEEGEAYDEQCKLTSERPKSKPGIHYLAKEAQGRILVPDYEKLNHLRHTCCWEKHHRPYVPLFAN